MPPGCRPGLAAGPGEPLQPWHERIERATRSLPAEHQRIVFSYLSDVLDSNPALDAATAPS